MRKLSLAELGRMNTEDHKKSRKLPVIIVLDNLRSQHNIGAIFRTADAFRLEAVYLCGITATPPNREIHKTALGATDSVDWKYFENTMQCIPEIRQKDYQICCVEQTNGSISLNNFELPASEGIAIVFGNEVTGVDQEVIDQCHMSIEIPQFGTKHSLNVSVSAGIVLWDILNKFIIRNPGIIA